MLFTVDKLSLFKKYSPVKNEHFTFLFYIICIYSLNEIVVFPNDFIYFFL
ncbi:hypothetical protein XBJ2_1240061 [Xenorhabdus bovienii str. Jollieti]|uniref:Uncharacterized protein n=1 Tax=Xenorhabdus bovienii (strain SS-2004) TaxID=406818 RepID=D3V263_XENBS|nr:hypothetical protein XBJ1_2287 [Xenorhabdus bovienii SS-2004]CDH27197.1 hypothetical protein XBJ2_1240061 [Xenorhabdus bovienii str. Jollieti]